MSQESVDVIKAWKDPEYRANLTEEQRASLPTSPAGTAELSEEQLREIAGGTTPWCISAAGGLIVSSRVCG